MNRLEELLNIPDKYKRQTALVKYAKCLGVRCQEAVDKDGGYNEEKLALLIYDASKEQKKANLHNLNFALIGLVICTVLVVMIQLSPKLFVSVYEDETNLDTKKTNVIRGYDKSGNPVIDESGQPVLFKFMDGIYQEFNKGGHLKYEYLYEEGTLVKKTELDRRGKVLYERTFPED